MSVLEGETPTICCLNCVVPTGATTTGPDATHPPAICQNSGGGHLGGGSSRGSGGVKPGVGGGVLPGVGGGGLARGQGGVQPRVRGVGGQG